METRKHIAAEKKRCGSHNCAQAILCTYADKVGIDEETARNIANSFGAGMGNLEGTCGALIGAGITLGMFTKDRAKSMKGMKQMMTHANVLIVWLMQQSFWKNSLRRKIDHADNTRFRKDNE
jgi:C_GCAxxG_C_C family probable redox protein